MWKNTYKDYKPDTPWVKQRVEPGKGLVGCEMQELNGWGENYHLHRLKKKGILRLFIELLYRKVK